MNVICKWGVPAFQFATLSCTDIIKSKVSLNKHQSQKACIRLACYCVNILKHIFCIIYVMSVKFR